MSSPADIAYAEHLVRVTQIYFTAIYSVTVWDWILALPKEYERIWKNPWSLIKVLYLFNRYWTILVLGLSLGSFLSNFTQQTCDRFVIWIPALCMWVTVCSECILLVRTYAIWQKNKYVLWGLITLLTGEIAVLLTSLHIFRPVPISGVGPCIATGGSKNGKDFTVAYWVSPIVFDTVVLILTLYRCIRYMKQGTRTPILKLFLRDGVLYFGCIFICNLINTIFYLLPNPALQAVNSPMSLLLTSVACSHIILNLRAEEAHAIAAVGQGTFFRNHAAGQATNLSSSHGAHGVSKGAQHNQSMGGLAVALNDLRDQSSANSREKHDRLSIEEESNGVGLTTYNLTRGGYEMNGVQVGVMVHVQDEHAPKPEYSAERRPTSRG